MPLSFQTINRGTIAFGFFNIDSDLLLMDHSFIFAPEFCGHIGDLAEDPGDELFRDSWEVDIIDDPKEIGDLMGAIHNVRHLGFIGEVYKKHPFPPDPEDFRQKPEGFETRAEISAILGRYSRKASIAFEANPRSGQVNIGDLAFTRLDFLELIQYVWLGGYPRWRDMVRPDYVSRMRRRVEAGPNPIFEGFVFSTEIV